MDAKHNAEKPPAEETFAQTTRLDKDHTKWWAALALVVVLIAIILVRPTNTPATTQADPLPADGYFDGVLKKAKGGDADAQFNLAGMYYNGQGVTQDYKQVVKWCTKAAEQGNANAQFYLGAKYDNGRGVPQNYKEAAKWYTKAAEQGVASAQGNLGVMYYKGQGVIEDYIEAYKWFLIAAANGNENVMDIKRILREEFTSHQIAEAQRLAKEFKPSAEGPNPTR